MAQVDAIKAIITADDAQFQDAVKRTSSSTSKLAGDFAKLARGVAAFSAVAASASAVILKLANDGIQLADQSIKTARSIGITSAQLEGLRFAAQQSGVSTSQLDQSLRQFTVRLGDALKGTGETAEALKRLGLNAGELSRMGIDDAMGKVADALDGVGNQAERARLAFQLFGRQGVDMMRMLEGGSQALSETAEEARRFGVMLDSVQTRAIEDATNAQGRMAESLKGLKMQLGAEFAPAITSASNAMADFVATVTNSIPTMLSFARALFSIRQEAAQMSMRQIDAELERVNSRIDSIMGRLGRFGATPRQQEMIGELLKRRFELEEQRRMLTEEIATGFVPPEEILVAEQERVISHFDALEEIQVDALRRRRDLDAEYYELKRRQEERALEEEIRIRDRGVSNMRSNFGQSFSLLGQHSKKMFALQKAYAISDAIVSAYQGISKTLAAYPYPLSAAMAASQAALAFAQVASIKSQQFGTGGGGTGVAAAGGGAAAAAPMAPQQPQQTLTVRGIDANTLVAGADVRILAERLLDYQRDGGRVVFA